MQPKAPTLSLYTKLRKPYSYYMKMFPPVIIIIISSSITIIIIIVLEKHSEIRS